MTTTAATAQITQPVTIYGPNLPRSLSDKGTLVAHAAGCADTRKGVYTSLRSQVEWTIQASSIEDIIEAIYGDFEDYPENPQADPEAYAAYRTDVYVFPCVDLPEHIAAPPASSHHLYDAHTAEDLGPATPEQVAASDEAYAKDGSGGFLIDADGDVVADGSWEAQQPGVRSVYTEVA